MPSKFVKTPYDDLTYRIIGCAMAVHRKRGPGYRENTYQRDLEVHFTESGIAYVAQKSIEVYDSLDENVLIGYYIPDFIVEGTVIVEIKALLRPSRSVGRGIPGGVSLETWVLPGVPVSPDR